MQKLSASESDVGARSGPCTAMGAIARRPRKFQERGRLAREF